tara:strand:- start:1220 stop:1516 length:297 start_codon:yes stop_codon:yes gene_type:complete
MKNTEENNGKGLFASIQDTLYFNSKPYTAEMLIEDLNRLNEYTNKENKRRMSLPSISKLKLKDVEHFNDSSVYSIEFREGNYILSGKAWKSLYVIGDK